MEHPVVAETNFNRERRRLVWQFFNGLL